MDEQVCAVPDPNGGQAGFLSGTVPPDQLVLAVAPLGDAEIIPGNVRKLAMIEPFVPPGRVAPAVSSASLNGAPRERVS
jgi:hypothetical protein